MSSRYIERIPANRRRLVVGLDLSTTRTGIATPAKGNKTRTDSIRPPTKAKRSMRHIWIATQIVAQIPHACPLIVIEGHSFGSNKANQSALHECAGVVKAQLHKQRKRYVTIAPKTLKKYATGDGNADKAEMVAAATAHGGTPANDDEADAYWLRQIGLIIVGKNEPRTPYETKLRDQKRNEVIA